MDYKFKIKATAFDFFKMCMRETYSLPLGICNIVFFIAAVLLTVKFYGNASAVVRALLIIMCLGFPVIQPVCIFGRALKLARMMPEDMTIETTKSGLLVKVGEASELVAYNKIKKVISTRDCLILNLGGRNGYFLFNRVLGNKKEEFTKFITSKTV
ncbi:MAG: YcxB family protein [Lachnospiraceae bacterium]|nr:YcxB family protein [Lachnospiraceae bacterium]